MRRHMWSRVMVGVGILFLLAAGLWRIVGIPAIVRFPTDVDEVKSYTGSFIVRADPETIAPLAEPVVLNLEISRHVQVVDSSFANVVIREDITTKFTNTELATALGIDPPAPEAHSYVMDRRSMKLRGGPDSWAYSPENTVDRSQTYRLNLPLDFDQGGTYRMWNNELGTSYGLQGADGKKITTANLDVFDFQGAQAGPVADYYADRLHAEGVPASATITQLASFLGGDSSARLTGALDDLAGALSGSDAAAVRDARTTPVTLQPAYSFIGRIGVEPSSGALVDAHAIQQGISLRPDLNAVAGLTDVVGRHPATPGASVVLSTLRELSALTPPTVFEVRYNQTPQSVAASVDEAKRGLQDKHLAEFWVQWSLVWIAAAFILGAGIVYGRLDRFNRPMPRVQPIDLREAIDRSIAADQPDRTPTHH